MTREQAISKLNQLETRFRNIGNPMDADLVVAMRDAIQKPETNPEHYAFSMTLLADRAYRLGG